MLCQNCGRNEATTHIKRIVNGEATELHLCTGCAAHLGYADMFSGFGFNISSILGSFFPETSLPAAGEEPLRCSTCGFTFDDIVRTGMMGCADCYDTFYDKLKPSLTRIHGRASHIGKVSTSADSLTERRDRIRDLTAQLQEAVRTQDFEHAAELRDEINALKGADHQ
ncbi:MAG: UvrB/UvrC motif-containing protein [Clostridia bacterium]|jgi:protein arginine kinase activator|nr:UvrB/UvrC motif-containing protein [Clostridia bacterium]